MMARGRFPRHLCTDRAALDPTALTDPLLDPSCRCEHAAPSLPIESDTSMLMVAESSITAPSSASATGTPGALALRAHLCFCTLHLAPATVRAHASTPSLH